MSPEGFSLLGREGELARLGALASQAAAGRGVVVLVEGEAGIGKSALLAGAAVQCAGLGMRVLHGVADDLEQRLPFAAIGNCLGITQLGVRTSSVDPAVARVAGLLRGEGAFEQSDAAAMHEYVVTEAILELLDQWCTSGPVALIMDDLQWADPSSVLVLHRLGRFINEMPLLMVVASGPPPRGEAAARFLRNVTSQRAETVTLAALDEPAVALMVERLLGAHAGPGLPGLVAGAGGNPLYLSELVAVLSREGAIEVTDGVAQPSGSPDTADFEHRGIPPSLVEVILQRLDFLPGKAQEILPMAAVLGPSMDVSELSVVLDMSVMELWAAVGSAVEAGLIVDRGRHLEFRHELIRHAFAGRVPEPVRTALHVRASQVLASTGAPVERVAQHLLAGTTIDHHIVEWLIREAGLLTARAPELAVTLLNRTLTLTDDADSRTGQLRLRLVRALLWAGREGEAADAARTFLQHNDDPRAGATARWLLTQAEYRQGHHAEASRTAEAALSSPDLSDAELGRFLGFVAQCYMNQLRFDESEACATKAVAVGEAHGDPIASGFGYAALALLQISQGEVQQALVLSERAIAAVKAGVQTDLRLGTPHYLRGSCLLELNRLPEADEALALAIRLNQQGPAGRTSLVLNHFSRARLRFLDGRWDDALAEITTAADLPDPLKYAPVLRSLATLIALHRGTFDPQLGSVPEPEDGLGSRDFAYLMRWPKALALETSSEPQQALEELVKAWEQTGNLVPQRLRHYILPDLARLAMAVNDRERVLGLATLMDAAAAKQPSMGLMATAKLCRGLADSDPGPLLAAANYYKAARWPLYEGQAYEYAATALAGQQRITEARDALSRSLTLYAGLDAAWDAARAEARLRQAGIRRGITGRRKRPKSGWEALTDTENQVVLMVAEGCSNPDIAARMYLSRRTVQTHVSSVLAKLSLSSRVELAVSASRRAPSDASR